MRLIKRCDAQRVVIMHAVNYIFMVSCILKSFFLQLWFTWLCDVMHTMKLKPKAIFSNHLFGLSNFNIHEEDQTRPTLLYSKRHSRMQCTYSPQYLDVFSALLLHSICVHKENNPLTSSLHLSYYSILYKEYVQCTSRGEMGGGRRVLRAGTGT